MDAAMLEAIEVLSSQQAAMERIWTLALEYNAKTITPERFAQRTYEILYDFDKATRNRPTAPA